MVNLDFIKIISSYEKNQLDGYNFLVKIDGILKNISITDTFLSTENIRDKEDIYKLCIYFFISIKILKLGTYQQILYMIIHLKIYL